MRRRRDGAELEPARLARDHGHARTGRYAWAVRARGSTGPEGQVGAGSTEAWFTHDLSSTPDITGGLDLLELVLPAGSYVIHGKSVLANRDTSHWQGAFCEIKIGSTDLDRSDVTLEEQGFVSGGNASVSTIPLRAIQ